MKKLSFHLFSPSFLVVIFFAIFITLSHDVSAFQSNIPDYLEYKVKGTGQTTGHIATLTVYNPSPKPVELTIPVCYIPSSGKYQSYVIAEETSQTVGINQTATIPLHGYCADIHKPAVPDSVDMPGVSDWVFENENYFAENPLPETGDTNPTGAIQATIPGTDTTIPTVIKGTENPEQFGQLAIAAIKKIAESYESNKADLDNPYHGQPEKEREAVLQHTFWLYTSVLSGEPYKIENLKENLIKQYETNSGEKFENATPEVQQNIDEGVGNLWDSFTLVGVEAKVISVANDDVDYDDIEKRDDLPKLIKPGYDKYSAARAFGKSHKEAMKEAFVSEKARKRWDAVFKRIYGK